MALKDWKKYDSYGTPSKRDDYKNAKTGDYLILEIQNNKSKNASKKTPK